MNLNSKKVHWKVLVAVTRLFNDYSSIASEAKYKMIHGIDVL